MLLFPASIFFAAGEDAPKGFDPTILFLPLIFVLFYFMLIRPQRRQQKELQLKLAALRTGDEVIACGGIHGLITNVSDRILTLKIADNVKIRVERASVMSILKKADEPEPEPAPYVADSPPAN